MLQNTLEKTPFLLQEGRLQHARRACSRTLKGLFLLQEKALSEWRGGVIVEISSQILFVSSAFPIPFLFVFL